MKKITFITLLLTFNFAQANLDHCLQDSNTHGSHTRGISPDHNCPDILRSHPQKSEARSSNGRKYIYGLKNMFYVEELEPNESGTSTILKRELMAGDQTGLRNIIKININEKMKRILVLQDEGKQAGLMVFDLEFVGNVSPLRHFKTKRLKKASSFKFLEQQLEIAIMSVSEKSVWFYNSDADSRFKGEKFTFKLLRELTGKNTLLENPVDIIVSAKKKKIVILDNERLLFYPIYATGNYSPIKIILVPNAESLEVDEEKGVLIIKKNSGRLFDVAL